LCGTEDFINRKIQISAILLFERCPIFAKVSSARESTGERQNICNARLEV
jgi:hypothetical protein